MDSLLWGKDMDPAIAAFLMVVTVIHEANCSGAGEGWIATVTLDKATRSALRWGTKLD